MSAGAEIKRIREFNNLSVNKIAGLIGIDAERLRKWEQKDLNPRADDAEKIESYFGVNISDLHTIEKISFSSKKVPDIKTDQSNSKLIPFYDGVTIGGMQQTASMEAITQPSEWIDAGDWFRDATGAMRHYGDSMKEYESGCIIVFKEVHNVDLIIPGRNYVIETSEYRITKKVAKGKTGFIIAHSTNIETYPDGSLVHQPFEINLKNAKLHLIIGKVEKEGSSTPVKIKK